MMNFKMRFMTMVTMLVVAVMAVTAQDTTPTMQITLDKAIELGLPVVVESEGEDPTGPDEITRCFRFLEGLGK